MNSLTRHRQEMEENWRTLQYKWQTACQYWNDKKRSDFERKYWERFQSDTRFFLKELEQLSKEVERASREIQRY